MSATLGGVSGPITILAVDDNPAALYATARVLRSAGYQVIEAITGKAALRDAGKADLVVLDINLPDMDGFEVCRRLRARPETAQLPVLHLSATFTQTTDFALGLEAGADSYLTRPVEAPVLLAYSARNRSASCRIPYTSNPKAKRVEVRFPDPMANPYLGFAAMLMAGLDGIKNKLDPGPAMDKDLYDLPKEELKSIPTVCGSLREALENLDKDRAFLKAGGVFDDDFIDAYIELKMTEVARYEMTPHPVEFEMYYSL